ncbi:cbb3-type cytochrome oxidase assembly protein CcoS [Winogradskyella thalassocola]|uniref:Cytochrome oxidase maturation protein, cbb3-type n=1 Tax=Winogradskyella thalassocola TaxID=262004 RepID=A0A1G8AU10_9FLAO|nr:cbb3-type cytochrome oxidase assembly protein CcoS [Winogradskyella thalassocola]SDH24387.1 cytochrome oxidase maturation protein, cbb3-type [Winogradskyella thalassocola]
MIFIIFSNRPQYYFWAITSVGMSVIYILLSVSVVIGVAFFVIFLMAVKSGQYDDDYTPSVRMLFEDELVKKQTKTTKQTKTD